MELAKEYLLEKLQEKAKELGRTPLASEMCKPSYRTYFRKFGSYNNAVREAGLEVNNCTVPSEDLLYFLERYLSKCKQKPKVYNIPRYATIINRFGSIENAAKIIGFENLFMKK